MDKLQVTFADLKKAQENCMKQAELFKVRGYGIVMQLNVKLLFQLRELFVKDSILLD